MKKAPKIKTYETITVPEDQTWTPECPYDGGTLDSHKTLPGVVVCLFCKRRFNIHYEGDED